MLNIDYARHMIVDDLTPMAHRYIIALGSNRAGRFGSNPRAMVEAALSQLAADPRLRVIARAPIIATRPIGPARRGFANSAARVDSMLSPPALLALLQTFERKFGRRKGRRWGDRPLDLDIILWSGGRYRTRDLRIPHPCYHQRAFVLDPICAIARDWRDPRYGHNMAHLRARLAYCGNNG
ncbi:2-amino-4-hydroxy-6-hydroxymethyldihydropteridine diphosphokinase [Aquisediminimonas sediminicola]|uniref:2-amino-4-hydroxy-6- hydroxymethyldihydropteridine diphosphokinase n=1 Tax=Alteraquisediminimonas sediminicola TaxID=2676787 RepID=UPI001FEA5517|nr:2-amino-4-hydroxy-6-hydroxymethyldihydropteridine diphosphokinase [Aquisediminimonas sediminicola]